MKALAIGGTADHLHALLSLPGMMSFAKAVQLIKGGSSKWVHDTFASHQKFAWQEGYGAFSVSVSQAPQTIAYISNPKRASSPEDFRRGVHRAIEAPRRRLRFAIRFLTSAVRFTDYGPFGICFPTDESVGYCHSSASPTFAAMRSA